MVPQLLHLMVQPLSTRNNVFKHGLGLRVVARKLLLLLRFVFEFYAEAIDLNYAYVTVMDNGRAIPCIS